MPLCPNPALAAPGLPSIRTIRILVSALAAVVIFPSLSAADACSGGTSCSSCIGQSGCGWNGASCVLGSGSGPANSEDSGSTWDYDTCPCSSATHCQNCTALSGCGWDGYNCRAGTSSGPNSGSSTGQWYYGACIYIGSAGGVELGVIVGVVIGVLVVGILVCVGCFFWHKQSTARAAAGDRELTYVPMATNTSPSNNKIAATESATPSSTQAP
jgi:hypothetical protein